MVYLVGAGPGDKDLVTIKGLDKIKTADVIVYDHLLNPTLLNYAKGDCVLIYAGKIAGNHHLEQEKINETLVKYGKKSNVVRLKGGDPFIFGRGGEETEALENNNIPYEIIPGISSCYSAGEYCGIPVTYRGEASSFHVITGHEKKGAQTVNYSAVAALNGTLVFLMGLSAAENISRKLIENGKSPFTPTAIISNGTTHMQKHIVGTLKILPEMAKKMPSPAVIIVGNVVGLRREWFEPSGINILTTGSPAINSRIRAASGKLGVTEISLIKTVPINYEQFENTDLAQFTHIVFTSINGVHIFFEYMKKSKTDIRILRNIKFAVVGQKTADALAENGVYADIIPQQHSGKYLSEELIVQYRENDNFLLVRAENAVDTIPKMLKQKGISFTDMALYKTETDLSKKEVLNLCAGDMDYIVFSSGSAARAFREMIDSKCNAKLISIGQETTQAANQCGLKIYKTAPCPSAEGIIECIRGDMK